MREIDWKKDCYHWHQAGTQSPTSFCFLVRRFNTEPFLSREATAPGWPVYSLAAQQIWLNLTDHVTLLSLYYILNADTFFFWFPIHAIHFRCPMFRQVQYPVLKSLTNRSVKGQYATFVSLEHWHSKSTLFLMHEHRSLIKAKNMTQLPKPQDRKCFFFRYLLWIYWK